MKKCKSGYYYCNTSKKCKKIPKGHHVMPSGYLMRDSEHKEEETKKNGNGANGNGNGNGESNGGSNGGGVSEAWSARYKRSIDCDNPKGFSQRAHCQGRKKVTEAKNGDHEVSMAQSQLKKSEKNIAKLRKALGKKERNIPAWVQAKITDTEHNTDAASSYMEEDKKDKLKEISKQLAGASKMHAQQSKKVAAVADAIEEAKKCWKGYKKTGTQTLFGKTYNRCVKAGYEAEGEQLDEKRDGKSAKDPGYSLRDWFKGGGWVQAGGKYDGKPCAKQPGQKTKPFCRDADDRASMSKDERNRRAAKKRAEDPNPDRKGKAKMVTASFSNWRQELQLDEKKDACYHKVKSRYSVWPSAYASGALVKCRKVGAANWGNKTKKESYEFSNWRDDYQPIEIETTDLITADEVIKEAKMTDAQMDKRERIVKSMKKNFAGFKKRYGDDAKSVMYATATKQALNAHYDWRAELDEDWQKVNKSDNTDGMSQKAVNAYRRENPGSKLKTAVTGDPKPGSKDAKRRKSFCSRSDGQRKMHNIDCSKTPDKAICKARRRWKC